MFVILFALLALLTPAMAQDAIPQEVITQEDVAATPAKTTAQPLTAEELKRIETIQQELEKNSQQIMLYNKMVQHHCEPMKSMSAEVLKNKEEAGHIPDPDTAQRVKAIWDAQEAEHTASYTKCVQGYKDDYSFDARIRYQEIANNELKRLWAKQNAYLAFEDKQAGDIACSQGNREACQDAQEWGAEQRRRQAYRDGRDFRELSNISGRN